MPRDARKHQKRKEKQNKRARDKHKLLVKQANTTPFDAIARAANGAFVDCRLNADAFDEGMGNLVVRRAISNSRSVAVAFLLDLYCLGVKSVICELSSADRRQASEFDRAFQSAGAIYMTPEEAKKLVVGAVEFAQRFQLFPHEDYARVKGIFAGIDESACDREFEFGRGGKPFYINGPRDNMAFQRRVIDTLTRSAGPGNFDSLFVGDLRSLEDQFDLDGIDDYDDVDKLDDDEFPDGPIIDAPTDRRL